MTRRQFVASSAAAAVAPKPIHTIAYGSPCSGVIRRFTAPMAWQPIGVYEMVLSDEPTSNESLIRRANEILKRYS